MSFFKLSSYHGFNDPLWDRIFDPKRSLGRRTLRYILKSNKNYAEKLFNKRRDDYNKKSTCTQDHNCFFVCLPFFCTPITCDIASVEWPILRLCLHATMLQKTKRIITPLDIFVSYNKKKRYKNSVWFKSMKYESI